MKKYIEDSKNKPREKVRITRSVGLQVGIALLSLQQQREEEEQQAKIKLNAAGSRIATKPAPARDSLTNGVVRVAANSPAKNSEWRVDWSDWGFPSGIPPALWPCRCPALAG